MVGARHRGGGAQHSGGRRGQARPGGAAASRRAHRTGDLARNIRCSGPAGARGEPRPHRGPDGRSRIMADGNATLTLGEGNHGFPVRQGSVGPDVIDIRKLYAETGAFTYDPGFTSTAACESAITY